MKFRGRIVKTQKSQSGFTIIELMIATAVLSTILLLVTVIMISIGNLYYKGISQSRTQDDVRSITDDVTQQLKLSGSIAATGQDNINWGGKNTTVYAYCIGSFRYTYVLNLEIGSSGNDANGMPLIPHVLWRDDGSNQSVQISPSVHGCEPVTLTNANLASADSSGTELLSPNSRLTTFCVGTANADGSCQFNVTSPYDLSVGVAYGSSDLLNLSGLGTTCKGNTGDQFCATASLATTIVQRLTP